VTLKVNAPGASEVCVTGHIIGPNAHWLSAPRKSIPSQTNSPRPEISAARMLSGTGKPLALQPAS